MIAEARFCNISDPVVTLERLAKGDLVWGDWTLGYEIVRDGFGQPVADCNGNLRYERQSIVGWRRDRLTPSGRTRPSPH